MPFSNPITGGQGALIRPAIKSPNYVPNVSGWSINRDGSAEFNNVVVRGNITAGTITAGSIGSSNIINSTFVDGTIERTEITFDDDGGTLLIYTTATTVVTDVTPGAGVFNVPPGVTTLMVECVGGGTAGGSGGFNIPGGGGGGGEYAAELALAVTPGAAIAYTVGAEGVVNGSGGNPGGDSFFPGDTVTVYAHGAPAIVDPTSRQGGAGGTGSTNALHFNGGAGGAGGTLYNGGGGGSSAGYSQSGNNGAVGPSVTPGPGGAGGDSPFGGGGAGGDGASLNGLGAGAGGAPGGGGGGADAVSATNASGGPGQVIITYTSARTLIGSISPVAGTDQYGNPYPAGISSNAYSLINAVGLGSVPNFPAYLSSGTAVANRFLATRGSSDTHDHWYVDYDGTMYWGSGSGLIDTGLYRSGVRSLFVDGSLTVDGDLSATGIGYTEYAIKPTDQSKTNNTLVDDTALLFTGLAANAIYEAEFFICFTGQGGDFKTQWSLPTGASCIRFCHGPTANTADTTNNPDNMTGNWRAAPHNADSIYAINSTSIYACAMERAVISTVGNTGNVTLRWAQVTTNGTATVVRGSSSYAKMRRIG